MPRPNRYHPYARPQISGPAVMSPRYPPPPSHRHPQPLPSISETSTTNNNTLSFQPIYPGYIRAVTTDGHPLIARSVFQDTNGMFHIQMEAVRYPSQCLPASQIQTQSQFQSQTHTQPQPQPQPYPGLDAQHPGTGMDIDNRLAAAVTLANVGVKRADSLVDGSEKSIDDECAIETGDEEEGDADAEGDVDEEFQRVVFRQRRMMFEGFREECASRGF